MSERSIKVTVYFERRDDGGLRAWSEEVPGLVLSHTDVDGVIEDVRTALEVILADELGRPVVAAPLHSYRDIRAMLEDGGVVDPKPFVPGSREYVAYVN